MKNLKVLKKKSPRIKTMFVFYFIANANLKDSKWNTVLKVINKN